LVLTALLVTNKGLKTVLIDMYFKFASSLFIWFYQGILM